ncbi:MAG: beta-galactosidase [Clostridia bacterium]|nr:beta-galactosidase [Clostridia bacterium]
MVYGFKGKLLPPEGEAHIGLGGDNGIDRIEVTNRYLKKNGKPWLPFMGEYHFSRSRPCEWKTELLKMRAGGINVVSSYVIWIHHEETEGELSFSGSLDIRSFVKTCFECGMYVLLRIGPWIHGEVKNGGFPDWLIKKEGIKLRCNNTVYLEYCRKWYSALYEQLKGLLFKDGYGMIGFQIENELQRDKEHIRALLNIAKECGLEAPLYTATAWGIPTDAELPETGILPMFGAYSERPWAGHIHRLEPSKHYCFGDIRNDHTIGEDLNIRSESRTAAIDYTRYPFATCELGGGVQVTFPRRPLVTPEEIGALTNVKLGSGMNLAGFYMYHGGRNPLGRTTTMQETKKSGYPNDLPAIEYDFQAPLGAWGAVRGQYRLLRLQALFAEDFGDRLAVCSPHYAEHSVTSVYDSDTLRYSARLDGEKGFVFINNYSREIRLSEHNEVRFEVDGYTFPKTGLNIKSGEFGFIPLNFQMEDIRLLHSAAQPVCRCGNAYFFFTPFGGNDEMCFLADSVKNIEGSADIVYKSDDITVRNIKSPLKLCGSDSCIQLVVLSRDEAIHFTRSCGCAFIADCDIYSDGDEICFYGVHNDRIKASVFDSGKFRSVNIAAPEPIDSQIYLTEIPAELPDSMAFDEAELSEERIRSWEIKLPENRENLILCFDINGDIAQLFADGKLVADTFPNGRRWFVGPDDFLKCTRLVLSVKAFKTSDKYIEAKLCDGIIINKALGMRLYTVKASIDDLFEERK